MLEGTLPLHNADQIRPLASSDLETKTTIGKQKYEDILQNHPLSANRRTLPRGRARQRECGRPTEAFQRRLLRARNLRVRFGVRASHTHGRWKRFRSCHSSWPVRPDL